MSTSPLRVLLASALLSSAISSAHAIPILRLTTSEGATATVTDGGAGDWNSLAGVVTFSGGLGSNDWIVNVTTGLSKPLLGSAEQPILDLNSVNVSSYGAAGWIDIELTDTGFTEKTGANVISAIGGTTNGSVSYRTFYDSSNTAFGQANELANIGPLSTLAFSSTSSTTFSSATPYSLTLLARIWHSGSGLQVSSFDATVQVPEPSSLLLLGAGLLAMAVTVRRRRGTPTALRAS